MRILEDFTERGRSFIKSMKRSGPRIEPCGIRLLLNLKSWQRRSKENKYTYYNYVKVYDRFTVALCFKFGSKFFLADAFNMWSFEPGGDTPIHKLYGDVPPFRVWFLDRPLIKRVLNSKIFEDFYKQGLKFTHFDEKMSGI